MRSRTSQFHLALLIAGINIALSVFSASVKAAVQEKPKLKDFGSSLKRLKWDPNKRTAVEIKDKKEGKKQSKSNEEDVVRVETWLVVCDVLVLDRQGRAVQGLTRDDFIVTEDGSRRKSASLRSEIMPRFRVRLF